MGDFSELGLISDLWEYWGFTPWSSDGMKGVYRRVSFVKSGMLGEVCRYYADDYIIWSHHGKADRVRLLKACKPQADLMTQRYLFVERAEAVEKCAIRSFLLGFRGYAEVHTFSPGGAIGKRIKDLAPLVDKAVELFQSRKNETGGDIG